MKNRIFGWMTLMGALALLLAIGTIGCSDDLVGPAGDQTVVANDGLDVANAKPTGDNPNKAGGKDKGGGQGGAPTTTHLGLAGAMSIDGLSLTGLKATSTTLYFDNGSQEHPDLEVFSVAPEIGNCSFKLPRGMSEQDAYDLATPYLNTTAPSRWYIYSTTGNSTDTYNGITQWLEVPNHGTVEVAIRHAPAHWTDVAVRVDHETSVDGNPTITFSGGSLVVWDRSLKSKDSWVMACKDHGAVATLEYEPLPQ